MESDEKPVRSALTPKVEGWAVQVVKKEGGYATVFSVDHQHFVLAEGNESVDEKKHCEFIRDQFEAAIAKVVLLVHPELKSEIDVDGIMSPDGSTQYIGRAKRQPNGKYVCLARVGNALCLVEVKLSVSKD